MIAVPTRRAIISLAFTSAVIISGFWIRPLAFVGLGVDAAILTMIGFQALRLRSSAIPQFELHTSSSVSIGRPIFVEIELTLPNAPATWLEARLDTPQSWTPLSAPDRIHLDTGTRKTLTFRYRPTRRGRFSVKSLELRLSRDGWLSSIISRENVDLTVDVFPDVRNLNETLQLLQKDRLNHMGIHSSRLAGTGIEVSGLRDYAPDDSASRIDWKVTTRLQQPVVRTYQHESRGWCTVLMDCGRHMAGEEQSITALDHAVNSLLILAGVVSRTGDYLQVLGFHDSVAHHMPPDRGRAMPGRVARFSARLQPELVESNYRLACEYALRICRRSSLIVLISDLLDATRADDLVEWFARLRRRHTPVLVLLRDKELYMEAARSGDDVEDEYLSAAARDTQMQRAAAVALIRSHHIPVVDVLPGELTPPLVQTYVRYRSRQSLRLAQ